MWAVILLFRVSKSFNPFPSLTSWLTGIAEMKLVTAAIYSNFKTSIVDDDGIEAIDAYTVKPRSDKLILEFTHI